MAAKLGKKAVSSLVQLDLSWDVFWIGFELKSWRINKKNQKKWSNSVL
jgi:hypothetical protein